jgi:pantothenate kinase
MIKPEPTLHPEIIQRLDALATGPRKLLGVVGAPGAGKSTLASLMAQALGDKAQAVPMDGFHLAQTELVRQGTEARKGAPHTFDAAGYAALLRRLKNQPDGEVVYAPDFRREIEEPVAGAIAVFPETPLVISEGNYLLLENAAWCQLTGLFDEIWYLHVDRDLRLARLTERHMQFGRSRDQATAWITSNDEHNARVIEASADRAHRQVGWDEAASMFVFSAR